MLGTQMLATLRMAVHDAPWFGHDGVCGGYALAWFLVNDRVKLLAYWILDDV